MIYVTTITSTTIHVPIITVTVLALAALVSLALGAAIYRRFFRRPAYARLLVEMGSETRRFLDSQSLLDHITARLKTALGAEFVRFSEKPYSAGSDLSADCRKPVLAVTIGSDDRQRGYLLFGERLKGQHFQSEDLHFVRAVAAQLSAALEQFEQQRRQHELQDLAIKSELKALRAQINPHFLFNTLNTLSDLIQTNPADAEKVTMNLARIFQFTLEVTRHEQIPLGEEADFVRSYFEIEHARFENKLLYTIDIPAELRSLPVPPMLIQPLVENAVKHGISQKVGGGCVTVRARRTDHWLSITVEDDGVGFDLAKATLLENGIGLSNVRQRVENISGPGHWVIQSTLGKGTIISFDLEIPAGRN
jgi:signal transduction histidine kinase